MKEVLIMVNTLISIRYKDGNLDTFELNSSIDTINVIKNQILSSQYDFIEICSQYISKAEIKTISIENID